jgi:hypothetical protein
VLVVDWDVHRIYRIAPTTYGPPMHPISRARVEWRHKHTHTRVRLSALRTLTGRDTQWACACSGPHIDRYQKQQG